MHLLCALHTDIPASELRTQPTDGRVCPPSAPDAAACAGSRGGVLRGGGAGARGAAGPGAPVLGRAQAHRHGGRGGVAQARAAAREPGRAPERRQRPRVRAPGLQRNAHAAGQPGRRAARALRPPRLQGARRGAGQLAAAGGRRSPQTLRRGLDAFRHANGFYWMCHIAYRKLCCGSAAPGCQHTRELTLSLPFNQALRGCLCAHV
jgi:hypothetical protein